VQRFVDLIFLAVSESFLRREFASNERLASMWSRVKRVGDPVSKSVRSGRLAQYKTSEYFLKKAVKVTPSFTAAARSAPFIVKAELLHMRIGHQLK
jgi:uncharacterized protein YaaR (DUF327 family)